MAFDAAIKKVLAKVAEIPGIGTSIVYKRVSSGSYNATTGDVRESVSETTLKGVFEDVNFREVAGLVQSDDRKCTIAADAISFIPSTADRVTASGVTYQIVRVKMVEQAGTQISYELYLRA